jgi:hypothetical protein
MAETCTEDAARKAHATHEDSRPAASSDLKMTKILELAEVGLSYRLMGRHVELSKNTVERRTNESKFTRPKMVTA